MEEYLETLLEQIRCKKAHDLVRREIEGHMEEQISENMAEGMTRKEAVEAAVKDMGDPVATGVELDRIHRPQVEWRLVLVVAGLTLFSLIAHYFMARDCQAMGNYSWKSELIVSVLGLILMGFVYRLDYTWIGQYAKWIGGIFCGSMLGSIWLARPIHGARAYVNFGWTSISTVLILHLFVPIYGAILFQYRGTGKQGLLKSVLWIIMPVSLAFGIPNIGLAMMMGVVLSALLSIAVWKGWFQISKKRFLFLYWGSLLILPLLLFEILLKFSLFQNSKNMNLQFYLGDLPNGIYSAQELLTKMITGSHWIGSTHLEDLEQLPSVVHTYVLTSMAAYYGVVIAIVAVGILLFMTAKIFSIANHQKNQLGQMMGYGCGFVFLSLIVSNVAMNLGVTVWSYGDLPFLSASGSTALVSYLLMGIVLSTYRYKNILPCHSKKKRKVKIRIEEA